MKRITLEWSYKPKDFFEVLNNIKIDNCTLQIANGKIICDMYVDAYDIDTDLKYRLHQALIGYFEASQLTYGVPFNINGPDITITSEDGKKLHKKLLAANAILIADIVDCKLTSANGTVAYDSKTERIRGQQEVGALGALFYGSDQTAKAILDSLSKAKSDLDNELVYLYEIIETLEKRFKKRNEIKKRLNVEINYSEFEKICNNKYIRQSRHRGQAQGDLRDATPQELQKVREDVKELTIAYLKYINAQSEKNCT